MTSAQSDRNHDALVNARYAGKVAAQRDEAKAEVKRLRGLAQEVLDALDAEKTPDYGEGHDRAHRAALAMLGKELKPVKGRSVPLDELPEVR